ncbi:hypothetical protein [Duganella violaceipulchra]|uniref:Uncharacterized protein n=1 Tax=Duganella violaceipulchra TaxID=2849652 RepID=A0AA41L178_9BURK|nr:hypothetical protein [Duganella violaceicalia]MBV6320293.1 hypothetical protein [Duganella violaceicalia]MCP2011742.1 hypothetical protein [Duganella violaceicalia]
MSVTSTYTFIQGYFNGIFICQNAVSAADQLFTESPPGSVVSVVHRPSGEIVVDLGKLINTNANVGMVANQLIAAGASLTSGLRVQGTPWIGVPYFIQSPAAHKPFDMLAKVNFDFHIETPWACTDIDGTISVFLFVFLDSQKHLHVTVDGTWFSFEGGLPFCAGPASDALKAAMPAVRKQVQNLLPQLTSAIANVKFSQAYYLPGNGTKAAGTFVQNASVDTALGLLPA